MKKDFYSPRKSSALSRFFWKAAGADRYILERVTYSDQVKYMCLGGILVSTGIMASLAGGYAFYMIFEPRGAAIESEFSWPISIISIFFGMLWGLMIFNLDRFIVSSTGKGDGTEAITWSELKSAIPRLILGSIIAFTISKPIEIKMFKTEIDVELQQEQQKKAEQFLHNIEINYAERIEREKEKITKWENEIKEKENDYKEHQILLNEEMAGHRGGEYGKGPVARELENEAKKSEQELQRIRSINEPQITQALENLKKHEADKQREIEFSEKAASGLDGLLARIKLAHKIAGFWISLFITLLFLAIELMPIFFKLMLVRSPYDFLKENIEELIKAENGIHIEYNYHKDKKGQEKDLIIHLQKEKSIAEKISLQKTQKELTEYAISKYQEEMKKKIDANPEAFIKVQENNNERKNEN